MPGSSQSKRQRLETHLAKALAVAALAAIVTFWWCSRWIATRSAGRHHYKTKLESSRIAEGANRHETESAFGLRAAAARFKKEREICE